MFKFGKVALASLVAIGAMSTAAAAPFYLDTGVDFAFPAPNGSTKTSPVDELGYTGTLATSIYLGNPVTPGTTVIDTNIASVMTGFGFSTGLKNPVSGPPNSLNFKFPADPANLNINALNTPPDVNGFGSGEPPFPYGTFAAGPGTGVWGLTYQYQLNGTTVDVSGPGGVGPADGISDQVKYTSGFFDIFYQDTQTGPGGSPNDNKKVLRLVVTGSQFQGVNLSLFGTVDYTAPGINGADPFVQNLFNTPTGVSFYSQADAVSWIIDTNVNPPIPTPQQLWLSPTGALIRQSTLDGSITFAVPEPGSLALLGLALAGAGIASSRRRKA